MNKNVLFIQRTLLLRILGNFLPTKPADILSLRKEAKELFIQVHSIFRKSRNPQLNVRYT